MQKEEIKNGRKGKRKEKIVKVGYDDLRST